MDVFKSIVWDAFIDYFIHKVLFFGVSWLSGGPLGAIATWIITFFTDKAYAALKLFIQTEAIILRNEISQQQYASASITLSIILREKGLDSPEYKRQHEIEKEDFYNLVRFRTAA